MSDKIFFQLWCYYETKDEWKMERLFRSEKEAYDRHAQLWDDADTLCMSDYAIVEVKGKW